MGLTCIERRSDKCVNVRTHHNASLFVSSAYPVFVSLSFFLLSSANKESITVDYNVLANSAQSLAFFLPEAPSEMLQIFDEVMYCSYQYLMK